MCFLGLLYTTESTKSSRLQAISSPSSLFQDQEDTMCRHRDILLRQSFNTHSAAAIQLELSLS